MIDIPVSDRYMDNAGKPMQHYPCVICGREVKPGPKTAYVHLHYGGGVAILPEEEEQANRECPGGNLGAYPVGADCLRKHPELKPYVDA